MVLVLDLLYKCFLDVPQSMVPWASTTQDHADVSSQLKQSKEAGVRHHTSLPGEAGPLCPPHRCVWALGFWF